MQGDSARHTGDLGTVRHTGTWVNKTCGFRSPQDVGPKAAFGSASKRTGGARKHHAQQMTAPWMLMFPGICIALLTKCEAKHWHREEGTERGAGRGVLAPCPAPASAPAGPTGWAGSPHVTHCGQRDSTAPFPRSKVPTESAAKAVVSHSHSQHKLIKGTQG